LWGKNPTVLVGLLLQLLLEALAHPLLTFDEHLRLDFPQRTTGFLFRVLHTDLLGWFSDSGGEPFTPPLWRQCQDAPCRCELNAGRFGLQPSVQDAGD
jgi:hypothetical protein